MNNDDADLADLDLGEQATEIFNVTSSDGTSHQIVITVNGANEGDPNDNDHMATSPTVVIMASGNTGADILVGSSGNDTLMGGQANDTIYGGAGNDTIYGYDPTSSTNAADADLIYGGSGDDTIFGNQRNDIIYGGSGNDVIRGNGGSDTLYGGLGADQFVYDAPSDAVDTIMDFEHNVDKIVFDNAGFTGLADGPLSASAFATGTAATTSAHRIIYNSLTGELFYDADGSGAGTKVLIADFDNLPVLTASDFIVV